jgi:hypothetical protein
MTTPQNRRWPWGRIIASTLACAILGFSIYLFFSSAETRRLADEARLAQPIRLKMDFSKPGSYKGEFRHTFIGSHDGFLEIVTEPPQKSMQDAQKIAEGLTGRFSIIGPKGAVVDERRFDLKSIGAFETEPGRWVTVVGRDRFRFEKGVYELRLTVDKGAPRLAGVPHFLVARYGLCGLEHVAAQIVWMMAVAGCVIAALILLPVALITVTEHFRPSDSQNSKEIPAED